jgi:hypothetical protein
MDQADTDTSTEKIKKTGGYTTKEDRWICPIWDAEKKYKIILKEGYPRFSWA